MRLFFFFFSFGRFLAHSVFGTPAAPQAPRDGMENVIWAFSRTPPVSADVDVHIAVHHMFGRSKLNLTRTAASPSPSEDEDTPLSVPVPAPSAEVGDDNGGDEGEGKGERPSSGVGGFANFVHAALCTVAFLLVIPSGALVMRFAKVTGSSAAINLHRNLQFGVGAFCVFATWSSITSSVRRISRWRGLTQLAHASRGV